MQIRSHTRSRSRISWTAIVASFSSWALSIVTTAALAAVGWYGHATHWSFGFGGHGPHDTSHAAPHADDAPAAVADGTVRFPSQKSLERSGIEVVPVEKRPVVS